ncbi:MAG TPA: DNA mismatch repair endonuclease MutL [Blastocatellia bacterium]|nr:DNA mismatch repair endonuclease MutL [Blastocatellia bacterium]
MSKIRVLPDSLANKIAAGEVVERPASIVKELIENSIDAGARRVEMVIESGGRRLIRVSDDGEGMSRDDAILAFERHATSKIKTAEDLESIVTLGFRGEALASIASVAKVRLRTQTAQDLAGTEIEISGGRVLHVRDIPFARGAEFEIRDLFFNVPARRKFLKSEATESFHIANLVTHYALANPPLSFTLINNNRESIRVTPAADLRERAYQIFGGEFIGDLIEVAAGSGEMRVRGFVSSPSATRTTRDSQYFFINGRYVRDKVLTKALSEAYRAMVPSGVYPSAMLFVELPPHEVDVNVHPAKTEVRFVRSAIVHDLVRDAVRAAIGTAKAAATPWQKAAPAPLPPAESPAPAIFEEPPPPITPEDLRSGFRLQSPPPRPAPQQQKIDLGFAHPETRPAAPPPAPIKPHAIPAEPHEPHGAEVEFEVEFEAEPQTAAVQSVEPAAYGKRIGCLGTRGGDSANSNLKPAQNLTLAADEITPLGQLHQSFIIAADRTGLLLIDQHVAHERILFEQHWHALRSRRVEVQQLLIPETLDLTPAQAAAFDQLLPELEENGFEIGHLSGRTIAIKAVPALLAPGAAQALLLELLDAIDEERRGLSLDELRAEIAASLACRAAIKINMPLAPEKMRWLIDQLLIMENPATCPHGRPIILRITAREIEKGFQRS